MQGDLSRTKQIAFSVLLVVLLAGLFEAAGAYATLLLVRRGWIAYLPAISSERASHYFTSRNPLLGWGPQVDAAGRVQRLQPRPDPSFSPDAEACVSVYGDSFTQGDEAPDAGTYPHHLGLALGCRVANYGQGGYGSDQALMLFRAQRHLDRAEIVILAHLSENILRNVNQYRNLLYPGSDLQFKPRYQLRGDQLRYVPIPVKSEADLRALRGEPRRFLPLDAFLSRPRRSFPYTVAGLRWATTDFHVRARLSGRPRHAAFYSPDHPSGALQLTQRILETFEAQARSEGREPFVLLIPVAADLAYARETGRWVDQPLADALRRRKVNVIHAGPEMLARLGDRDPCDLFTTCNAHFNAEGYKLLADIVAERVKTVRPERARVVPGPPGSGVTAS